MTELHPNHSQCRPIPAATKFTPSFKMEFWNCIFPGNCRRMKTANQTSSHSKSHIMNTPQVDMTTNPIDLTLELRSADGSSTEFYQADEERVRETLRLLASPQLFARRHLLLASQHWRIWPSSARTAPTAW